MINSADDALGEWEDWAEEYRAATAPLITRLVEQGGGAAIDAMDDVGLAVAFDVTNPKVAEWLAGYTMKFAAKINETLRNDLRGTLNQGLAAGEGMRDLEARVQSVMGEEATAYRSEMIARTESHRAEQQGELQAWKQSGVAVRKVWQANPDACDFCDSMDGAEAELDTPFFEVGDSMTLPSAENEDEPGPSMSFGYEDVDTAALHPNCVIGGTEVMAPDVVGTYSGSYSGLAVEVLCANGAAVTVTPNHLFLTDRGFAPAYLLREGDNIVDGRRLERICVGEPEHDREPSVIEEVVEAFAMTPGMLRASMPATAEHLHGDGGGFDGNVDIVRADRLLELNIRETTGGNRQGDLYFQRCGDDGAFPSGGTLTQTLIGMAHSANGGVGGTRQAAPFFRRRLSHAKEHGFASSAKRDACVSQNALKTGATNTDCARERQATLTGSIPFTQVCGVQIGAFRGHVYDLQTVSTLYICGGLVSSNCRCTTIYEVI